MSVSSQPGSENIPPSREDDPVVALGAKTAGHDPYAAFRSRAYSFSSAGNLLSIIGRQMLAVSVEWEIYARTHFGHRARPGWTRHCRPGGRVFASGRASGRSLQPSQYHSSHPDIQRDRFARARPCVVAARLSIPAVWPIPQARSFCFQRSRVFLKSTTRPIGSTIRPSR